MLSKFLWANKVPIYKNCVRITKLMHCDLTEYAIRVISVEQTNFDDLHGGDSESPAYECLAE